MGLIILNVGKGSNLVGSALFGNILVFLAVIPEALFTIVSKSVGTKISETAAVTLVNFFNLIMFIPFAAFSLAHLNLTNFNMATSGLIILYGISGGIMFFLLWYRGLTKINANIAALFTGVMPISTTILAALFLKESIHSSDIIGMLLVIAAIFVGCNTKLLKK